MSISTNMAEKIVDVTVWGATGYTGRLVCEHLAKHACKFSFTIAGRDPEKLSLLLDHLVVLNPNLAVFYYSLLVDEARYRHCAGQSINQDNVCAISCIDLNCWSIL